MHALAAEGHEPRLLWPGAPHYQPRLDAAAAAAAWRAIVGADDGADDSDDDDDDEVACEPIEVGVDVLEVDRSRPEAQLLEGWRPPVHLRTLALGARRRRKLQEG